MLNLVTVIFQDFSGSMGGRIGMLSLYVSSFLMVAIPAVIISFLLNDHRTRKVTKFLLGTFLIGLYVMEWTLNPINGILITIILITATLLMIEYRYQQCRRNEYTTENGLLYAIFVWLKERDVRREEEREAQKLESELQDEADSEKDVETLDEKESTE